MPTDPLNPLKSLLASVIQDLGGQPVTAGFVEQFIASQMNVPENFELFDDAGTITSRKTILFSGNFVDPVTGDKVWTGNIARDLAEQADGPVRLLPDTKMGRFLDDLEKNGLADLAPEVPPGDINELIDWNTASDRFVRQTKGALVTVIGNDAEAGKVYGQYETQAIRETTTISTVNGGDYADIVGKINNSNLSPEQKNALLMMETGKDFAAVFEAKGLGVSYEAPDAIGRSHRASINFAPGGGEALGLGPLSGVATDLGNTWSPRTVQKTAGMIVLADGKIANQLASHIAGLDADGVDEAIRQEYSGRRLENALQILDEIQNTTSPHFEPRQSIYARLTALLGQAGSEDLAQKIMHFIADDSGALALPEGAIGAGVDATLAQTNKILKGFWDQTLGVFKYDTATVGQYAGKVGLGVVGMALGGLDAVAIIKKHGVLSQEFAIWSATAVATVAATPALTAGAAMLYAVPVLGPVATYALVGAGLYYGIKTVATNLVDAYANEPDSRIYIAAKHVVDFYAAFEAGVGNIIENVANSSKLFQAAFGGHDLAAMNASALMTADGENVVFAHDQKGAWMLGNDNAVLLGGKENDWIIHRGYGEAKGGEGGDVLVGLFASVLNAGEKIGAPPASDEPDNRRTTGVDLSLTLDGGKRDDWVITALGEGVTTIGGLGHDWIFNTSRGGVIYTDTYSGLDENGAPIDQDARNPDNSLTNADNVWWWHGTTLMDPRENDQLRFFGFPLVGGTNEVPTLGLMGFGGLNGGLGGSPLYFDYLLPFMQYMYDGERLYVMNILSNFMGLGDAVKLGGANGDGPSVKGVMVIENFDNAPAVSFGADILKVSGDLGMTFKNANRDLAILSTANLNEMIKWTVAA